MEACKRHYYTQISVFTLCTRTDHTTSAHHSTFHLTKEGPPNSHATPSPEPFTSIPIPSKTLHNPSATTTASTASHLINQPTDHNARMQNIHPHPWSFKSLSRRFEKKRLFTAAYCLWLL